MLIKEEVGEAVWQMWPVGAVIAIQRLEAIIRKEYEHTRLLEKYAESMHWYVFASDVELTEQCETRGDALDRCNAIEKELEDNSRRQ